MIRRHPHVFENTAHMSVDDVAANWEKIKQQENGEKSTTQLGHIQARFPR